jgi:RIO-like serine/threonine protein kinase
MEETLREIFQLNDEGYVHCNMSMANIVVDYTDGIRLGNFD